MRRKRIYANLIASIVGRGARTLQHLLLVPLFISAWGADYYGAWLALTAIPTVLSMSNLGLGTAASTKIVIEIGRGHEDEANAVLIAAVTGIFLIFALVFTLGLLFFEGGLHMEGQISSPESVVILQLLTVGLGIVCQPFDGFWIARKKAVWCIHAITIWEVGRVVVITIALFLGRDALGVCLYLLILRVMWLIAYIGATFHLIEFRCGFASFSVCRARVLIWKGMGFQCGSLWQAVYFQGSILLASFVLGPSGAAAWGTLRILSRAGNQVLGLVNQSVVPEMQTAFSSGELRTASKLHSYALAVACACGVVAGIALITIGAYVYGIWTDGQFSVPFLAWPMLGIGLVANSLWWTSIAVHRVTNQPWRVNLYATLFSACSLAVMWGVAHLSRTVVGLCAGALLFEIAMAAYVLPRSLSIFGDRWSVLWSDIRSVARSRYVSRRIPSWRKKAELG